MRNADWDSFITLLASHWCGVDSLGALVENVCMYVTRWHFLLDWRFHQATQILQLDVLFWHKYLRMKNLVQAHCSCNCMLFLFLLFFLFTWAHLGGTLSQISVPLNVITCQFFNSWLSLSSFSVQILSGRYILLVYSQWQYYDIINTHPHTTTNDNNKESAEALVHMLKTAISLPPSPRKLKNEKIHAKKKKKKWRGCLSMRVLILNGAGKGS